MTARKSPPKYPSSHVFAYTHTHKQVITAISMNVALYKNSRKKNSRRTKFVIVGLDLLEAEIFIFKVQNVLNSGPSVPSLYTMGFVSPEKVCVNLYFSSPRKMKSHYQFLCLLSVCLSHLDRKNKKSYFKLLKS